MSSIMKLLRRIGGVKAVPTSGDEGQLAVWKAGKTPTDATSMYFHDGVQWVEILDTSRNPRVITANDAVAGLRVTQTGTGPALLVEDEANPDATPFVIDATGKVSIGTTSSVANAKLNIDGGGINVANGGIAMTSPAGPVLDYFVGTTRVATVNADATNMNIGAQGTANMNFQCGGATRLMILPTGDIISSLSSTPGPGSPGTKIFQNGNKLMISSHSGGGAIDIYKDNASYAMMFYIGPTSVGNIELRTNATIYATSSDYRLKEDMRPMSDVAARLAKLKPVNFAWKSDGSRVDGFIAHELQEVVPEAVTGKKDAVDEDGNPMYQGIDQGKIVPLLVAALQDALKRIEALEARP